MDDPARRDHDEDRSRGSTAYVAVAIIMFLLGFRAWSEHEQQQHAQATISPEPQAPKALAPLEFTEGEFAELAGMHRVEYADGGTAIYRISAAGQVQVMPTNPKGERGATLTGAA